MAAPIFLGEVIDINGTRPDIQLKGSCPTPWSRMGDGRAWLGPVLREYVVSEAMHALGIPTSRALAAVATGEKIYRESGALPGAVLTRVAASHIRVGTFSVFRRSPGYRPRYRRYTDMLPTDIFHRRRPRRSCSMRSSSDKPNWSRNGCPWASSTV